MSTTIIGILMIISFIGIVIYCIKGHNLMVGFLGMSTLWVVLAWIGHMLSPQAALEGKTFMNVLTAVFQDGPGNYAKSALVSIFYGAFFGRVLMDTGIASTLIRKTVELGGSRPSVTMVLLCIITSICFTSMTGIGPVVSLAVIVLPILMSLGISPATSLFSFMSAIMAGSYMNVQYYVQYGSTLSNMDPRFADYTFAEYSTYGVIAMIVALIVGTVVSLVFFKKQGVSHSWAATAKAAEPTDAPWYSWIAVLMPVLMIVFLKAPVVLAFIISAAYALLTCGKLKGSFTDICGMLARQFTDGAVDSAPMIGFVLVLSMFSAAAGYAAPYFKEVLGGLFPTSALLLCVLYAVIYPLGMFRGPLTLTGGGTATAAIVLSLAPWSISFVYPLFVTATITPQFIDLTQSWVSWGLGYTKVSSKDFMKHAVPTIWITGIILCAVIYFMFGSTALA